MRKLTESHIDTNLRRQVIDALVAAYEDKGAEYTADELVNVVYKGLTAISDEFSYGEAREVAEELLDKLSTLR